MNVNELIAALQQLADAHPGENIQIATTKTWPRPQPIHLQLRGTGSDLCVVFDLGKGDSR